MAHTIIFNPIRIKACIVLLVSVLVWACAYPAPGSDQLQNAKGHGNSGQAVTAYPIEIRDGEVFVTIGG